MHNLQALSLSSLLWGEYPTHVCLSVRLSVYLGTRSHVVAVPAFTPTPRPPMLEACMSLLLRRRGIGVHVDALDGAIVIPPH